MDEYQIKITATGIEDIENKLKKALDNASKSATPFKTNDKAIQQQLKSFEQLEKQKSKYQLQAAKDAERLAQKTANEQIKQSQRAYKEIERAALQSSKIAQKAHQDMVKGLETGFNNLAKTGAVVFAGISLLVGKLGKSAIDASIEIDDLKDAIQSLAKSGENVDLVFQGVTTLSQNSPFSSQNIMAGVRAMQEFGSTAQNSLSILHDMGDMASKLGVDLADAAKIYGGVGQGRFRASSLAEIGAGGETANIRAIYNKSGGAAAQKYLLDFLKNQFAGGMADDMRDIGVVITKAQDKFRQNVLAPIGDSFKPFIKGLSDALQPILTPQFGARLGTAIGHIVDSFGSKLLPIIENFATKLSNLDEAKLESALKVVAGVAGVAGSGAALGGLAQAGKFLYSPFAPILSATTAGLGAALGMKSGNIKLSPSIGTFNSNAALNNIISRATSAGEFNLPREVAIAHGAKNMMPVGNGVAKGFSQASVFDVGINSAIGAKDAQALIKSLGTVGGFVAKWSLIITAIVTAIEGIVENFEPIKNQFIQLKDTVMSVVKNIESDIQVMIPSFQGFGVLLSSAWAVLNQFFTELGNIIAAAIQGWTNSVQQLIIGIKGIFSVNIFQADHWARIKKESDDSYKALWDNIKNTFSNDWNAFIYSISNGKYGTPPQSKSRNTIYDSAGQPIAYNQFGFGRGTGIEHGAVATPSTQQENIYWPLSSDYTKVTSTMQSKRPGGLHGGIDIAAPAGTNVTAIEPGKVVQVWEAGAGNGGGKMVFVQDDSGTVIAYTHITGKLPKVNDIVAPGSTIGQVFKDHLDLKIMEQGVWDAWAKQGFAWNKTPWRLGATIDPLEFLKDASPINKAKGYAQYSDALDKYTEEQKKDYETKLKEEKERVEAQHKLEQQYAQAYMEQKSALATRLLGTDSRKAFGLGAAGILDPDRILQSFGINPQDIIAVNAKQSTLNLDAQRLSMMTPVVDDLRQKFQALADSTATLEGAVSGLQDNISQFNEAKAQAFGFAGEATAISADSALSKYNRANQQYNRWLDSTTLDKNGNPISNRLLLQNQDPFAIAQQANLVSGIYQSGASAYSLAAQLKGQEGYGSLASDLLKRTEEITAKNNVEKLGPDVLITADQALNTSASLLDIAARDLSSAAGTIANITNNQQAQQQAAQAMSNIVNGTPVVTGGNIPGISNGKFNILQNLGNSQYNFQSNSWKPNLGNIGSAGTIADIVPANTPTTSTYEWWDSDPTGSDYYKTYGCETGVCTYLYHHTGKGTNTENLADKYKGWKGPGAGAADQPKPEQPQAKAAGLDPMAWLWGGLNNAAQSWAGGATPKQAIRGVAPNMIQSLLSSIIPGSMGGLVSTIAGGFIGRLFGKEKKELAVIKPLPVFVTNFDTLGSTLNISRGYLLRGASYGINAIAGMRSQRAAVGV
jgi:hypothetical protein